MNFLFGIDPSSHLGRLDYASLPQQALMEMFIDGIINKEMICGSPEEAKDIKEWFHVELNEAEEVTEIKWSGGISLEWLPFTVQKVRMDKNFLSGTLDLTALPPSLVSLDLAHNKFSGNISLKTLPKKMEKLSLTANELNGTLELDELPRSMRSLFLGKNEFSGTMDLTNLPKNLRLLYLHRNSLSGTVDLAHLPATLEDLYLNNNEFEGETDFSMLPSGLELDVSNTKLSGEICIDDDEHPLFWHIVNSNVKEVRKGEITQPAI